MSTNDNVEEAVEALQQLGLKEYEAKCFVGLSRTETGTAKKLSEITDVPRTRVYDAIRVLEAEGLVEVHHSNPMQFRAVSVDEATETLLDRYETRVENLGDTLDEIDVIEPDDTSPVQEVWAMSGPECVENRTIDLVREASDEVVMVLGDHSVVSEELLDCLSDLEADVDLFVSTLTQRLRARIREEIPDAHTIVSELDVLARRPEATEGARIGRVMLVDRTTLLASSIVPETGVEQAIVGQGYTNGMVVVARRLVSEAIETTLDPT